MDDHEIYKRLNAITVQIGALERKVDFLFQHLGVTFVDTRPQLDDVERLVVAGDTIGAIRLYRERQRADLAEAKRAIEEMRARLGL